MIDSAFLDRSASDADIERLFKRCDGASLEPVGGDDRPEAYPTFPHPSGFGLFKAGVEGNE